MSIPQRARPAPVGRRKPNGTTLTDRIRQAVQRDIVAGKLRPGAKLDEDSLAARHGVPMPLSAGTLASFSAAVAGGAGDGDLAELAQCVRERMLQNFD